MADIVESDVKLYQSADQTDTATGGGRMSSNVIVSGVANNLFPNISRIDRLQGRIQLRKVFQKIDSANTAVYSGGHLIVRDMPMDENVSVLMFPTEDPNDQLPDITSFLESFYQATVPAGNAGLEYAVDVGDQQLVFKIRHYEYTPIYGPDGRLVYSKKMDAKWALNITVGELAILDDGAGTVEHIHIQQMERVTETLDESDDKHYYVVEYVIVTISAGLLNAFPVGTVPYRTEKNPSWKCFGPMVLGQAAAVGDTLLILSSTRSRIAPVIERNIAVSDQAFFGPPEMVNDVEVSADGISWSMGQAEQINTSEATIAVAGKTSYTHVLQHKPLKASTLEIWYRANLGWYVITETDGSLSGDGTGSVSSDGVVTFTLDQAADPDTHILFYYTREHDLAEHSGQDLSSDNVIYSEVQAAVPAETETATGTIADAPVQAGYVKVSIDQGTGWESFGTDGGAGVITGDNIEAGTIDYYTGEWSITFQSVYTQGVTLKIEYVPLAADSWDQAGGTADFAGKTSGTVLIPLTKSMVKAGSLSIALKAVYYTREQDGGSIVRETHEMIVNVTDDGNGNLSGSGDGSASGDIDYKTGEVTLTFFLDHPIDRVISWFSSYIYYKPAVFDQAALPYEFSLGYDQVLPGSFLIRYYTQGVDAPWYARDINGVLVLQAAFGAWEAGTDLPGYKTWREVFWTGSRWMITQTGDPGTAYAVKIWVSSDGKQWDEISHNLGTRDYLNHFAMKPGPVFVGVGVASSSSFGNVGVSSDLSTWTLQNVGPDIQFVDVAYAPVADIFIAISDGTVWTSSDDGATWTQQSTQLSADIKKVEVVQFAGGEKILVFGAGAAAQYSTDGVTWVSVNSALYNVIVGAGVVLTDGQETLFVADDWGHVSKSADGVSFTVVLPGLNGDAAGLASDGISYLVAVLTDGTIDISNDFGATWQNQTLAHQWEFVGEQQIAFSWDLGWLHLATDGATSPRPLRPAVLPHAIMTDGNGDPIKQVGTFDAATGTGAITAGDLPVSASARLFLTPRRVSDYVVFTWGAVPVHDNSFTAFGRTYTGALIMLAEDPANPGQLAGDGSGFIYKEAGVAELSFSFPIRPESLRISYSYGSIYKPEFDEINTRALPLDGLVPVIQKGDTAVLVEHARAKLTAGITDAEMAIDVDEGSIFPDREITVKIDDEEITGTMSGNTFSVSARGANSTTPASHLENTVMELVSRREEMLPVLQVAGNNVTTPNPLAYGYKAGGAILTTAVVKGDLQAQETDHFSQQSWDGSTWEDSDEYTGNPADGTYNFTNYPLELTNQGATTERWILEVVSLSPVLVDIRGEFLGVIATDQDTSAQIAPTNPNTGAPYFTLDAAGWGAGWQVGNILRFNTKMAGGPAWVARVINARASDIQDDYATLQSRGDVAV